MDEELRKTIERLIAQNHRLGQKQIALECVCSAILAQLALLSPEPVEALDRFNSELCGTAMGVAAHLRAFGVVQDYDSKDFTKTMETLANLSENLFVSKRASVLAPSIA